MKDIVQRVLGTIAFILISLITMGLALTFVFSLLIVGAIAYVVHKLRGQPFSLRQFWHRHRARQQATTSAFKRRYQPAGQRFQRPDESQVTDVAFKEVSRE